MGLHVLPTWSCAVVSRPKYDVAPVDAFHLNVRILSDASGLKFVGTGGAQVSSSSIVSAALDGDPSSTPDGRGPNPMSTVSSAQSVSWMALMVNVLLVCVPLNVRPPLVSPVTL